MKLELSSKAAQDVRFAALVATAEGCPVALLAYADWLEEQGHDRQARQARHDYAVHVGDNSRPLHGNAPTWLAWLGQYLLGVMAERLIDETAFCRFAYTGAHGEDGQPKEEDGSLERALMTGYVPTLQKDGARQERLGRIVEAYGYNVFWIA